MSSHEAFAAHGQDLVIIVASHVGYDPDTFEFGMCKRWLTADESHSTNCGKIAGTLAWYPSLSLDPQCFSRPLND